MSSIVTAGLNEQGQCMVPEPEILWNLQKVILPNLAPIVQIVHGINHTLLLGDNGALVAVGGNASGQLGRGQQDFDGVGDDPDNRVPRSLTGFGLGKIKQIAAGKKHCAAITGGGGKLFTWGWNFAGQCGTGQRGAPVLAPTLCDLGALAETDVPAPRVVFVACGYSHTVALTSNGGVVVFGSQLFGALGTGNTHEYTTPHLLTCAALDRVRIVGCAAGASFTQLLSDEGRVFATGYNDHGQLGTGDMVHVYTPTEIDSARFGGAPVAAVACGSAHTMAITRGEGKLYCWGEGEHGATGLGLRVDAVAPLPVVGALAEARVVRIAAGMLHSCALTEDGRVFAFGNCGGIPVAGQQGVPQLLQEGEMAAGTTVRVISTGCCARNVAFVQGAPPNEPGFYNPTRISQEIQRLAAEYNRALEMYMEFRLLTNDANYPRWAKVILERRMNEVIRLLAEMNLMRLANGYRRHGSE